MAHFDPDAAAKPGSGVFGLPHSRAEARVVLIPVPFDATTSYGGGAAAGPEAILKASSQVDLLDHQFGAVHEAGIFMEEPDQQIAALSARARDLAKPIIEKGGAEARDKQAVSEVDTACEWVSRIVCDATTAVLDDKKIPGIVGGDHSTPLGAIRACAAAAGPDGLGILQVDAHMDLREAFEGFRYSHASIMWNVMQALPRVTRLVQVGIRDYGAGERRVAEESKGRIVAHHDLDWYRAMARSERLEDLCKRAIEPLPRDVYISFDIDGLDPSLCPRTGTPVPGGLSFNAACVLLETLARSGRRVIGFDLNEVCPGPDGDEWDAAVGARVLYKLCGVALTCSDRSVGAS